MWYFQPDLYCNTHHTGVSLFPGPTNSWARYRGRGSKVNREETVTPFQGASDSPQGVLLVSVDSLVADCIELLHVAGSQ